MYLRVFSIFLVLVSLCESQLGGDRNVLIEFYNGLSNPQVLGWNFNNSTLCGQRGIVCGSQRVRQFNMGGFGLNGTIPNSFGSLVSLEQMNMANNLLYGTIPSSLGQLTKLVQIYLDRNRLTGTVPASIGFAPAMLRVILNNNYLMGNYFQIIPANTNQLLIANNHFDCPATFYDNKVNDFFTQNSLCNLRCGSVVCPAGQYCAISGLNYTTSICRTPSSCSANGDHPMTPPSQTSTVFSCPANQYGNSTRQCYGDDMWFDPVLTCLPCPVGTTSVTGSNAGFFDCRCPTGFTLLSNGQCVDTNECSVNNGGCSPNALCQNSVGSFSCSCLDGFLGNGFVCDDIDECNNTNPCAPSGDCLNTVGSYECICRVDNGFQLLPDGSCVDIDECLNTEACIFPASCTNSIGSFTCLCPFLENIYNNVTGCPISIRVTSGLSYNPYGTWTFDRENGRNFFGTNSITPVNGWYSNFYQKNITFNKAIFLTRSLMTVDEPLPITNVFSVEVILNIATLLETDLVTLLPVGLSDPNFSPFRVRITDIGRLALFSGNRIFGSSLNSLSVGRTHYITISAQRLRTVFFVDGNVFSSFNFAFNQTGSYFLQIGSRFRGYIDEVSAFSVPLFRTDVEYRNSFLQCNLSCPNGCFNSPTAEQCI